MKLKEYMLIKTEYQITAVLSTDFVINRNQMCIAKIQICKQTNIEINQISNKLCTLLTRLTNSTNIANFSVELILAFRSTVTLPNLCNKRLTV